MDGSEEAAGLVEERDQGVADMVGEESGSGGGVEQDLETVSEEVAVALVATVVAVVVDGVIVAAETLEGDEVRFADGSTRERKDAADLQVLEAERLDQLAVGKSGFGIGDDSRVRKSTTGAGDSVSRVPVGSPKSTRSACLIWHNVDRA